MLTRILSYFAIALLWVLHFLPLSVLSLIGRRLGLLFFLLGKERRRVATINLSRCFPDLDPIQLGRLVKAHFEVLGRSMIERNLLWWASQKRLDRLIQIKGAETIYQLQKEGRPVIMLAPHFVGLDICGAGMAMRINAMSVYSVQKNKIFDRLIYNGRSRFGKQLLLSRQDGMRRIIKGLRDGYPFYYLPDMDFGAKDSIFVPFFGVQAATITGLSRLAKSTGAAVVPCISRILPGGKGYFVEIGAAWQDFPTDDVAADTRRMNAYIEEIVLTMPEQYFWVHKRFKTRLEGETKFY